MPAKSRWVRARAAVAAWLASVRPRRADLKADTLAALPGAISSVPEGMAVSVLAGVNPVHGRYASFAGADRGRADGRHPAAGDRDGERTAGTLLLVIATASGTALAAGSALEGVIQEQRPDALILLTLLAGLIMVGAAFVHVGRYFRSVSHWLRTLFRLVGVMDHDR